MDDLLIRHLVATLAYRTTKVIQDAPDNYPIFSAGSGVRTPVEILHHMSDLLLFALRALQPVEKVEVPVSDWETEVGRFYDTLTRLDEAMAQGSNPHTLTWEQLLQGPLSDAMTHAGQLTLLRRLAGHPVAGENYSRADIRAGRWDRP